MTGCPFQVVDKITRKLRPCRMKCGSDAVCRIHLHRHEFAELRLEVSRLGQKLSNCEAQIATLRAEIQQKATPPAVTPPPPPPPPRRTSSLPIDPLIALFKSSDGRTLASILRSKAPFNTYTDAVRLAQDDRTTWAVRTLNSLNTALIAHGTSTSERHSELRRFFCSSGVRVGHEVSSEELSRWLQSLSFSKSQDDLQAELRSALARRNSLGTTAADT
jgi:hypothetical protein